MYRFSFLVFFAGLVGATPDSFAATDYYWTISGSPPALASYKYGSAVEVCQAVESYFLTPGNTNWVESVELRLNKVSSGVCFGKGTSNGKPSVGNIAYIFRYGDACLNSGSLYVPETGHCDLPPEDVGLQCADQEGAAPGDPLVRQSSGSCVPLSASPTQKGKQDAPMLCPDTEASVNVLSGNVYLQEEDYRPAGGLKAGFSRAYNSIDGVWRHSFSTSLRIGGSAVVLVKSDGREVFFNVSGNSVTPSQSERGLLQKLAGEWVFFSVDNNRFSFDSLGRLVRVDYPTGDYRVLSYKDSTITVQDSYGQKITITEDYKHQPVSVSAPGAKIQYVYGTDGMLSKVTKTQGLQVDARLYHYEDARAGKLLTGITDERGVRYVRWNYDEKYRLVSYARTGAGGKIVGYTADGTTSITNEFGKRAVIHADIIRGNRYVVGVEGEPSANCPASNSAFTYDDRGQVLSRTDAKGLVTTYTYNDRGLETTRTEATGTPQARTITTTWHATFNLPLTVTDGRRVTTYNYDNQGRQTSRTQTTL